jgi:hypothetical protein
MTCLQLAQEGRAISKRGFEASGLPAGRGGTDSTELVPAIVFVWPVSSQAGDKQPSDKLALANHEMDALNRQVLQVSAASDFSKRQIRVKRGTPASALRPWDACPGVAGAVRAGRFWPAHGSPPWPARNAKSHTGITPCGLIRDCWFPSSADVKISGEEREGSGLLGKDSGGRSAPTQGSPASPARCSNSR